VSVTAGGEQGTGLRPEVKKARVTAHQRLEFGAFSPIAGAT
jgi:hypothetical protein